MKLFNRSDVESGADSILLFKIQTDVKVIKEQDYEMVSKTWNQESIDSLNQLYDFFENWSIDIEQNITLEQLVDQFKQDLLNIFDRDEWNRESFCSKIRGNVYQHTYPEEKFEQELGRLLIIHLVEDMKEEYTHQ